MALDNFPVHPEGRQRRHAWKRVAAWASVGIGCLILVIIVGALVVLHGPRAHRYILALAEKKASQTLGVQVELQNYGIHLSNLSVDLYGIAVHGATPHPNPPLLQVQHAEVGVRVVSILHRKWYLNTVRVDRPVVRILIGPNGESNLPKLPSSGGSQTSLFDLGIRHAILDRGEVYYNDKKTPLEADLHDLEFHSEFNALEKEYSGSLSYRDGHLFTGSFNPIPHDLDAQFAATPEKFQLTYAKLTSGPSQLALTATLENYRQPSLQGHYEAVLDCGQIARILHNSSVPSGVIDASGVLRFQNDPSLPFFDRLVIDGSLSSRQLELRTTSVRVPLTSIAGGYSLANGSAAVRDLRARVLGGMLTANMKTIDLAGSPHSELNLQLQGISLASLKRLAPSSAAPRELALSGTVNAGASATWGRNLQSLAARADATIHASIARAGNNGAAAATLPVEGALHGAYSAAEKRLVLTQSYLRMPQTTLTMNGAVGGNSNLAIRFVSKDLREIETVADMLRPQTPGASPAQLGLAGTASFQGTVRGSTEAPHLAGHLTATNLQVKETNWRTLRADVDLSPSSASLRNAELEAEPHGRIAFNASVGLRKWKFENTSPIQLDLHASEIAVADLSRITGKQAPVAGTLDADVRAQGTELNPAGQGSISLLHAKVYDEPIESAKVVFTSAGGEVHANAAVHLPAGTLNAVTSVRPGEESYTLQVTSKGIDLDQLQTLKSHNLDVKGRLDLNASGQGTFHNPELKATINAPQLEIQNQAISGLALQMSVANHVAQAAFSAREGNAPMQAKVKLGLTGNYPIDASLDTQPFALQPFLAIYAPSVAGQQLSGETEIHAVLEGPLKQKDLLEAHVTLPMLKVAYGSAVQLAASSPIHADYKNWVLTLQRTAIQGTDINLQLQGSIPIRNRDSASLLLEGTVNLQLAQLLDPDITSSGELRFNINGFQKTSGAEGKVELVNANFTNADWPVGLRSGNGVLTLTKNRLQIGQLSGTVGGGQISAQGGVTYNPNLGFDLGVTAKGVRMLYPQGVRESLDANLRLTGTMDDALLGGHVRIADLSFTPDFDLVSFATQFSGVSAPPPQGFEQNLNLNLAVSSANNLNPVSRSLSVNGTANLEVRGTAAEPVILGRVNVNNGDVIFNGNRFVLSGGTVEFANPSETQPVINLALTTTIQQYNINLRFRGPVDHLRTNYSSDPSLPEADIINLLAFGNTTEANAANPATPGSQAALSAVASQVSSQVTSRVSRIAGISQLSINPVLNGGSNQGPAGANLTIQQRVTGNLFVTFSTNVTSTQDQVIMGQYQLSPRVAISGTRDQNGGFAADVTLKKTW